MDNLEEEKGLKDSIVDKNTTFSYEDGVVGNLIKGIKHLTSLPAEIVIGISIK